MQLLSLVLMQFSVKMAENEPTDGFGSTGIVEFVVHYFLITYSISSGSIHSQNAKQKQKKSRGSWEMDIRM